MKRALAIFFLAAACGGAVPKTGGPSTNSNTSGSCGEDADCPVGQVCNTEGTCIVADCDFCTADQICYKPTPDSPGSCSAASNNIIVFNNSQNSDPGNLMTTTNCETRAECSTDQECVDSVCTNHQTCSGDGGGNGSGCEYEWRCDDNKTYRVFCDLQDDIQTVICECMINDVAITEFDGGSEGICPNDVVHRAVNENCGWLMPEP